MSTKRTLAVLLAAISLLFSSCAGESPDVTADESTSDERISEEITTDEITTDDSETTKTETTEPASDTTAAALTEDDIRSAIEKNLDVIAPTDSELVSEADAIAAHPEEFDRIVAPGRTPCRIFPKSGTDMSLSARTRQEICAVSSRRRRSTRSTRKNTISRSCLRTENTLLRRR